MSDGVLFLVFAGLAFAGYGIYKLDVRSRFESEIERLYRKSWGDTDVTPNPDVLRNNRYLGVILIITGLATLAVATFLAIFFAGA